MLSKQIEKIWCQQIKESYIKGILCSERQLQAELYHFLKSNLADHQVWLEPVIELETEKDKWKIIPDMLITYHQEIQAVIELKYVPYGEVKFKPDIEKMYTLSNQSNSKSFRLKTDPVNGNYTLVQFAIAKNILCIYAAIARGNHAWGVESRSFWIENNYQLNIPNNFLHLVGKVYSNQECAFIRLD